MAIRLTTGLFTLLSCALTALTIANAFLQKKQFYPAVIYITKSSPSMAVLYLQGLVLATLIFHMTKKMFFGQLSAAESEHLTERAWYAVTETCLAFTVFRDDFSPKFVMQFALLLFLKCFHWLCEDRVDFMERSPVITLLFHARMMSLLAILSAIDSYFVSLAYFTTLLRGASVQIVFGFEYAILMTIVMHVAIKYILHMHDLRSVHPWENKAVYLLYSELLVYGLRCFLYVAFMTVMMRLHTFPLFSIRPFYLTIRAFQKAAKDVVMSRKAIYYLNNYYPVATEQDLSQGDATCIICREDMTTALNNAKKLPCQHIFHVSCMRSWFQRQQTCPTCRTDLLAPATVFRLQRNGDQRNAPPANVQPNAQQQRQAQAQQQPQAGQFAHFFPFMAPNAGQQQVPPQQPSTSQAGTDQQPSTSATPSTQQANMGAFNFMPPMMPPFMMPPPFAFPAAPSMSGLTDVEVQSMEGRARAAVEARVQCLLNISTLLDAAVVQLQQYTSILTALSSTATQFETTPQTQPRQAERATSEPKMDTNSDTRLSPESDANISVKDSATTSLLVEADAANGSAFGEASTSDEVRQRRLEKFSGVQTSQDH